MKRIGLLGGLSAESTAHFYLGLTRLYIHRFGDAAYPEIVVFSVSFQRFLNLAKEGRWQEYAQGVADGFAALSAAGAEFGVITANMPHVVFDEIQDRTALPLLHIADVVSNAAQSMGYRSVGLMGTIATMRADFYPNRLQQCGIDCLVPDEAQQETIQQILEDELFLGRVSDASKREYLRIMESLEKRGAEAIILGCTEIPLLVQESESPLPFLDSADLLMKATLEAAI